jgi:hypothetical protein
VRQAGRRGRRRALGQPARDGREVEQHIQQVAQRQRSVRRGLEEGQLRLRPFQLRRGRREWQRRQSDEQQLEERVLLRRRPARHADQQLRQQRRALGGRRTAEGHLDVDERKVGDHRVAVGEEELDEPAERERDRRVTLDPLVDVAEDGHHLGLDRRLRRGEEAEDVGQCGLEQLGQLCVLAQPDAELGRIELFQQRGSGRHVLRVLGRGGSGVGGGRGGRRGSRPHPGRARARGAAVQVTQKADILVRVYINASRGGLELDAGNVVVLARGAPTGRCRGGAAAVAACGGRERRMESAPEPLALARAPDPAPLLLVPPPSPVAENLPRPPWSPPRQSNRHVGQTGWRSNHCMRHRLWKTCLPSHGSCTTSSLALYLAMQMAHSSSEGAPGTGQARLRSSSIASRVMG